MVLWFFFGGLLLANVLSGLIMGRVWVKTRFVGPDEPMRFYASLLGSLAAVILVIAFLVSEFR